MLFIVLYTKWEDEIITSAPIERLMNFRRRNKEILKQKLLMADMKSDQINKSQAKQNC